MHRLAIAILLSLNSPLFASSTESYKVIGPLTQHFQDWLAKFVYNIGRVINGLRLANRAANSVSIPFYTCRNGYKDDFVRADNGGTQGSYGGKSDDGQKVRLNRCFISSLKHFSIVIR